MAKTLQEWVETDVRAVIKKPVQWLSETYFFRDPIRPTFSDPSFFFSPADGIILYQKKVRPDENIVDFKGASYSLRDALRIGDFPHECLVIGIFMTFYDVHINRLPYSGRITYQELEPIETYNYPMLDIEHDLVRELRLDVRKADYLLCNQRMRNRVYAPGLGQNYWLLQIADFDVDSIMPFELKQNQPASQNQRFSQIRYGSQVDLIVPLSERFDFETIQEPLTHVEAGIDPLIRITDR